MTQAENDKRIKKAALLLYAKEQEQLASHYGSFITQRENVKASREDAVRARELASRIK